MRRVGAVLVLVVAVLAGGAGCVRVPEPVSATEAPRPALTVAQAGPLMQHLHEVVAKADRHQDVGTADDVLTGYELEAARGTWRFAKQIRTTGHYTVDDVDVLSVFSGPAAEYPQQAVVVGRYRDPDPDLARYRSLRHLVRTDAGSSWRLALSTWVPTGRLPALARPTDGITHFLEARTRLAGVRPATVPVTLANALNDPRGTTGRQFTTDPYKAADLAKEARGHHDHSTMTLTFYGRAEWVALPTADGGALVLAADGYVASTVADEGCYTYFRGSYKKAFSRHYASSAETGLSSSPVLVSPKGRLTLLGADITPVSFGATESSP